MLPPCEDGGVDPDTGLCLLGMPDVMPENRLAIEIWGDMNLLGWDVVRDLHDLQMTEESRGDLLVKLRVMADEAAKIQNERVEEAKRARNTATR